MKKIFSLLLTLIILCGIWNMPPVRTEEASPLSALMSELASLLDAREASGAVHSRLFAALDTFLEKNDYPSLVLARLACSDAIRELEALQVPDFSLTEEDLLALIGHGIETDSVEAEFREEKEAYNTALNQIEKFQTALFSLACLQDGLPLLRDMLDAAKRFTSHTAKSSAIWINYLLLPVAEAPETSAFWETYPARWPTLGTARDDWNPDASDLISRTVLALDDLEDSLDALNRLSGRSQALYQLYNTTSDSDPATAAEMLNRFDGQPPVLPLPADWQPPSSFRLFSGEEKSVENGLPAVMMCVFSDVPEDLFMAYVDLLTSMGMTVYSLEEGASGERKATLLLGSAIYMLHRQSKGRVVVAWEPAFLSPESGWYVTGLLAAQ